MLKQMYSIEVVPLRCNDLLIYSVEPSTSDSGIWNIDRYTREHIARIPFYYEADVASAALELADCPNLTAFKRLSSGVV